MPANDRPLTLEECRNLLYKYATHDPHDSDGSFKTALNLVLERLHSRGGHRGFTDAVTLTSNMDTPSSGLLALPYGYSTLVAVHIDEIPYQVVGQSLDFIPGAGPTTAGEGCFVIDQGWQNIDDGSGTNNQARRIYKVGPAYSSGQEIVGYCQRSFVPVDDEDDLVYPSNLYALKLGLMAVSYEDAGNTNKAQTAWDSCFQTFDDEFTTDQLGQYNVVSFGHGFEISSVKGMY